MKWKIKWLKNEPHAAGAVGKEVDRVSQLFGWPDLKCKIEVL